MLFETGHKRRVFNTTQEQSFNIASRTSWLSMAQVEIFKKRLEKIWPLSSLKPICKETFGDQDKLTPLEEIKVSNCFTAEIQSELLTGNADFAIHSLKDVDNFSFFNNNITAIIDRDMVQDIAIFKPNVVKRIEDGEEIIIGTSSPRRATHCIHFLQEHLPRHNEQGIKLKAKSIRGNVDERLQKLHETQMYDGIVLAVAGVNRLLEYKNSSVRVKDLLDDKLWMLLPLFECPPAPGQAAIVVETSFYNKEAGKVLEKINKSDLKQDVMEEMSLNDELTEKGYKNQGIFKMRTDHTQFLYAKAEKTNGETQTFWNFEKPMDISPSEILYLNDHMYNLFKYKSTKNVSLPKGSENIFVAHANCVREQQTRDYVKKRQVWVPGTQTWNKLAKMGIWVNGSTDGLGMKLLEDYKQTPFFRNRCNKMAVLTNSASKINYPENYEDIVATYHIHSKVTKELKQELKQAKAVFWTSYQQFNACKHYLPSTTKHLCASGKTAELMKSQGLNPFIFPTIQSFLQWRNSQ